jgi:hypothetical protein
MLAHDLQVVAHTLDLVAIERLIGDLERALQTSTAAGREAAEELVQYITHVQVIYRRTADAAWPLHAEIAGLSTRRA